MEIRADEISRIIREQIKDYGKKVAVAETGTRALAGRRHRPRLRPDGAMAGELLEFPGGVHGMVLNLEEDNVGVALLGPVRAHPRGRPGQAHRQDRRGAGRRGAARPRGQRARRADRRQRADRRPSRRRQIEIKAPGIIKRKSVHEPMQTGMKAIDALMPDRPRPARADHRRPPDRQDRRRHRHDHQPEGAERATASTWPSARSSRPWPAWWTSLKQARRDGVHDRRRGRTPPTRRRCSSSRRTPA